MSEVARVADQLERAFEGDAWHGPSLTELLADVTADQAAAHPLPGAHSIWEIVLHVTAWQRTVRERIQGDAVTPLPADLDWPGVEETSTAAWEAAIQDLRSEYEKLRDEVLQWGDRDLGTTPSGERYTVYEMLHGVIQHGLYHAGQIAVLKKSASGFVQ